MNYIALPDLLRTPHCVVCIKLHVLRKFLSRSDLNSLQQVFCDTDIDEARDWNEKREGKYDSEL